MTHSFLSLEEDVFELFCGLMTCFHRALEPRKIQASPYRPQIVRPKEFENVNKKWKNIRCFSFPGSSIRSELGPAGPEVQESADDLRSVQQCVSSPCPMFVWNWKNVGKKRKAWTSIDLRRRYLTLLPFEKVFGWLGWCNTQGPGEGIKVWSEYVSSLLEFA